MNPFFSSPVVSATARLNPGLLAQVKQVMSLVSSSKDPDKMMQMLSANNPAMSLLSKVVGGREPKDVFYELCKEHNINPDDILNQLK